MKDEVAERLAHAHYQLEPTIRLIRRLVADPAREADPDEPIKLLEVNDATTPDGIRPVYFAPHPASGIIYPSLIVEITPQEYDQIMKNNSLLPHDWQLGEVIDRVAAAR